MQKSVRLEEGTDRYVRRLAAIERRSANWMINDIIEKYQKDHPLLEDSPVIDVIPERESKFRLQLNGVDLGYLLLSSKGNVEFKVDTSKLVVT